jgi:hypothetical protein
MGWEPDDKTGTHATADLCADAAAMVLDNVAHQIQAKAQPGRTGAFAQPGVFFENAFFHAGGHARAAVFDMPPYPCHTLFIARLQRDIDRRFARCVLAGVFQQIQQRNAQQAFVA